MGYTMHVVSHTHWDREWYLTFQQFRIRLIDLIDNLLDILDSDPDFKHFGLDGQGRASETVECPVTTCFTVTAKSPRVDVVTEVENRAEDHRLRVLFPSGMTTGRIRSRGLRCMEIKILGTAASEGWPAIFCACETCRRAREVGGKNIRSRASVQFGPRYKIDLPRDT